MKNFIEDYREDNLRLLFPETTEKDTEVVTCGHQGPRIIVCYHAGAGFDKDLEIFIEKEILISDLVANDNIKMYTDKVYYDSEEEEWEVDVVYTLRLTAEGHEELKKRCKDLDGKVLPVLDDMIEAYRKM